MTDEIKKRKGRPPGTKTGRTRHLTSEEMHRFMKAAKAEGLVNYLFLTLTYAFAMRVSECCDLRRSDINSPAKQIRVRALKRGVDTWYNCPPDLWRLIATRLRHIDPHEECLFPARSRISASPHLSSQAAKCLFKKVAARAGITGRSIHGLRSSQAMALAGAGSNTQRIAGWLRHRDVESAMRYTVPIVDAELEAVAARLLRKLM
jgi:integrase/recombinase XerD